MAKLFKLAFVIVSFFISVHAVAQPHVLVQGWNLEGNDNGAAVDPNAIFGNATMATAISPSVTTVWTWDKNALQWNFFTPAMTPSALAAYAASKGYGVLTTIPQGQGFWVNARNAVTIDLAAATVLPTIATTTTAVPTTTTVASTTTTTVPISPTTSALNDTGITSSQCYQVGSDTLVACNSAGALALNNAQDGMTGRDANAATNSNADGKLGFSFTSVTGGCVQDNVTGLMWEVKTNDGGLRDLNKTYTNYSAAFDPSNQYGTSTDASGFVTAVNATNLCGYSDWRLPTADELQSIVDYGVASYPGPIIDATWFPNTHGSWFWSASHVVEVYGTPLLPAAGNAWSVDFRGDGIVNMYRDASLYVRLP